MKRTSPLVAVMLLAGTAHAAPPHTYAGRAAPPQTYAGVSLELSNGFDGASEFGFAAQVAPHRFLELEAGAIRHDVDGREDDTWLVTASARAKRPFGAGAVFAGFGVVTGEHGSQNGCTSSGFIDFCGDRNGTYVERYWERAVWVRPEFGAEFALSVVAARLTVSPVYQLTAPDTVTGCTECDDDEQGVVFTMGLHGRLPI